VFAISQTSTVDEHDGDDDEIKQRLVPVTEFWKSSSVCWVMRTTRRRTFRTHRLRVRPEVWLWSPV